MDKRTSLNRLPVIIHRPGLYLMRNGSHATIEQVDHYDKPDRLEVTVFEAKGKTIGKSKARGIWHVSGRFMPVEEGPLDIVARVRDSVTEYQRQGGCYCPVCGSADIEGEGVEVASGKATQVVFCPCGATWTDTYTLSGFTALEA